jgi:predicted RecB family nuclease
MSKSQTTIRICNKGHTYYKSSDCPVCPICEKEKAKSDKLFSGLSAPARRALENAGIKTLIQLSKKTETEILKLHGMGKSTIPKLRATLKSKGLLFKK